MLLQLGRRLYRRLFRAFSGPRARPGRDVTVVVTACGRDDLLKETIESFVAFNTYPISEFIIVEDSGRPGVHEAYRQRLPWPVRTIYNETNLGQIRSIDIAYSHVKTAYIFHCEDDWEFFKPGFIEKSLEILESDPMIFTVWLRPYDDTSGHPIEPEIRGNHRYMALNFANCWSGFTFNPGLRRMRDCARFLPYSRLEGLIPKGEKQSLEIGEVDLSIYHKLFGYRGAITLDPEGYARHIGWERHVKNPWEK